jgi:hypothetical protein
MGSLSIKEQKGHKIIVYAPLWILTNEGQIQTKRQVKIKIIFLLSSI